MVLLSLSSASAVSSSSTSQFSITFDNWEKFSKLRLKQVSIPNVQYNISSGDNSFTASGTKITIPVGSYSSTSLVSTLNGLLGALASPIKASYDVTTFKLTFTSSASFTLDFSSSPSVAKVLGFSTTSYTSSSDSLVAPNAIDLRGEDSFFIRISNLPSTNQGSGGFSFTFYVSVNQVSGQILFLSAAEEEQLVVLGQSFESNRFDVELRKRDGTYVDLLGLSWSMIIELIE